MAKVSAHGAVIGTLDYLTYSKRYMSDGVILKQIGDGWKLHGRVKPGVSPAQAFANAQAHQAANRAKRPAYDQYARELATIAGAKSRRWKLHYAVTLMPDDPDGVWSECCDGYGDNIHADVDDVCNLCRLYLAAVREGSTTDA